MPRKVIYVCYPFADDPAYRTVKVRYLARELEKQGYLPLAVHLYLPQILQMGVANTEIPGPVRERALEHGRQMVGWCDELWVFGDKMGDDGMPLLISDGMQGEMEEAVKADIPVIGKSMRDFVPSIILGEGRDKYVNLGMDLAMSTVRNNSGGWGVKIVSSSPDLAQNLFTIAQGFVILLQSSVSKDRVQGITDEFFDQVQWLIDGGTKPAQSYLM